MGRGPSNTEIAARVETILEMLAAGTRRAAIIKWSQSPACPWRTDDGGPLSDTTIDRYIRRAYAEFQKLAKPRKDRLLGVAYHRLDTLYQRSFGDKDYKTCLAVQAETNKLAGLYPATKLEHTGKDGGPIEVSDVRDRLAARIAALAVASEESDSPEQPE